MSRGNALPFLYTPDALQSPDGLAKSGLRLTT